MPELKLSVDLASLQLPLQRAISTAAGLGVRAVELDARGDLAPGVLSQTGLRQVRKLLDDARLSVAALRFRTRRGYYTPDDLERRIDATRRAMELAHSLGAPVVINHVGRVPPDAESDDWRLLVEVLSELGVYGNRTGALLAAETGSESGPDLARLLAALPPGTMGVDFNPGNLLVHGYAPLEAVEALGPAIFHVHATDAVGDTSRGLSELVPLGRGTVDYPALLGALEQHDYRGYYTLRALSPSNPVAEVEDALLSLRRL